MIRVGLWARATTCVSCKCTFTAGVKKARHAMKRTVIYIGSFPPPLGGVTVKNSLLLSRLSRYVEVEKVDMHAIRKGSLVELARFARCVLRRDAVFVIGLSRASREKMTSLLHRVNSDALERSIVFVMGRGLSDEDAAMEALSRCRRVYVETDSMLRKLSERGLVNVRLFPNCRHFEGTLSREIVTRPLRLVFMSTVDEKKGAGVILEALRELAQRGAQLSLDFWGPLMMQDNERFLRDVEACNVEGVTCAYRGVFDASADDATALLAQYDCMLLPSLWESEGVPGALVEAKGAAAPAIVSEGVASSGVICDNEDGLVLRDASDARELAARIAELDADRALLLKLQDGARRTGGRYEIDSYLPEILADLSSLSS